MNNYLNEEKIYKLINKIEKAVFYSDILSCKLEGSDVFALHEALMTLQQLNAKLLSNFKGKEDKEIKENLSLDCEKILQNFFSNFLK